MPALPSINPRINWPYALSVTAGKQPATERRGEENTGEPVITEPDEECVQLVAFDHHENGYITLHSESERPACDSHKIMEMCQHQAQAINKRCEKIADLPAGFARLAQRCEIIRSEQDAILKQRYKHSTELGIECFGTDFVLNDKPKELTEHVRQVAALFALSAKVLWAADKLSKDPKELNLNLELQQYIKEIRLERASVQGSLPRKIQASLWAIFVGSVLAVVAPAVWWGLVSLGLFSASALIPHIIVGIASAIFVAAGLVTRWVDFKNAWIDSAHEDTQRLIENYDSLLSIYDKGIKKKMEADTSRAANFSQLSAATAAISATYARETNSKLDEHSRKATSKLERLESELAIVKAQAAQQHALLQAMAQHMGMSIPIPVERNTSSFTEPAELASSVSSNESSTSSGTTTSIVQDPA